MKDWQTKQTLTLHSGAVNPPGRYRIVRSVHFVLCFVKKIKKTITKKGKNNYYEYMNFTFFKLRNLLLIWTKKSIENQSNLNNSIKTNL